MDHQLESLNLDDGGIGLEFDGGEQEVITSECFIEDEMDNDMKLEEVREEIPMDTESEIIIPDTMDDMNLVQAEQTISSEIPVVTETITIESPTKVHNTSDVTSVITHIATEPRKVTAIATSTPKPSRVNAGLNQKFTIGGSTSKPVSIAPKPLTMSNTSFLNMRKYSIAGVQPRPIGDIGGRQVVVVPTSGNRFKMVGTPIRTQTPVQIQVRQRTVPPLTKLTIPANKDASSGIITVQKSTPARFISIPPQQVGLLGGKITQFVAVSPSKQQVVSSATGVRPIRHNFTTIKSPTKILPAPQGGNKVILSAASQSLVVRPTVSKPPQVVKVDGSTILASIPAGQKINPQQIHQINIPGKGIQYVRLVPAPSIGSQNQSTVASTPSQVVTTSTTSVTQAHSTNTVTKLKNSPPQLLPKTYIITDFKNSVVQASGKGKSIINTTSPATSGVTRVFSKTTKIVPIAKSVAPQLTSIAQPSLQVKVSSSEEVKSSEVKEILTENQSMVLTTDASDDQSVMDSTEQHSSDTLQDVTNNSEESIEVIQDITEHEQEEEMQDMCHDPLSVVMMPSSYMQQQEESHHIHRTPDVAHIKDEFAEYPSKIDSAMEFGMRPRKPCNCTKSQCLKLYCDCFANGEFCNQCNCNNCHNNLENEEYRQKAIRSCLERNPNAFRPKIGKAKNNIGLDVVRRHNKGCNCKRSGCLKNYCECYEGKIACSANCKCVGCRNVEDAIDKKILRKSKVESAIGLSNDSYNQHQDSMGLSNSTSGAKAKLEPANAGVKSPCNIMTNDVIEAVCQCLIAQAADAENGGAGGSRKVLEEFAHCLKDIISVAQQHKSAII